MNLDLIEKHVHLTELPNGVEVMFGGQRCLTITESYDGGYSWRIEPLFAKITYGANVFEDVPYCSESSETIEEAVAAGLSTLNDLGALYGIVDTPEDTFSVEGGVDNMTSESVEELDEISTAQMSQQGKTTIKHIKNPKVSQRMAAHDIKPGIAGYRDRIALLKDAQAQGNLKEEVTQSLMQDCRKEALKHADSIMEAHDLAQGLYDSFIDELNEGSSYQKKRGSGRLTGSEPKRKIDHEEMAADADKLRAKIEHDKKAAAAKKIGIKESEELDEGSFNDSLKARASALVKKLNAPIKDPVLDEIGEILDTASKRRNDKLNKKYAQKFPQVVEDLDEAALSGDAYWKHKEAEEKETKAREERAKLGIKEPVKKGRGKPTNIDLEFVHAAAKKNLEAGKRPTAGMERNEKIHFVRHLSKHPDFNDHHVKTGGRPTGTTKAAKAEKEVEKKKEASAFSMWAGLGKK